MKPGYTDNDPKGWGGDPKRGAALGRPSTHAADSWAPLKLYLRRVPLDSGGYDPNGTYFGTGRGCAPLYWCADADGQVDYCLRARDRREARRLVSERYPNARFYR